MASDVFDLLDIDKNGELSDEEKKNFVYGPAYETSVIPYANWGESYYALTKFKKNLETLGKRLYMSFMYKDTWNIRDGVDDASFTINSLNGKSATSMTSFDRTNDKVIDGTIKGTAKVNSFHAGIYPDMIKSFVMVDANAKTYKDAQTNIDKLTSGKEFKVFNVKGDLGDNLTASIIDNLNLSFDLKEYKDAELYKITGEDVDKVEDVSNVKVSSSKVNFLLVYSKDAEQTIKKGCKSSLSLLPLAFIVPSALGIVILKKKENL